MHRRQNTPLYLSPPGLVIAALLALARFVTTPATDAGIPCAEPDHETHVIATREGHQ